MSKHWHYLQVHYLHILGINAKHHSNLVSFLNIIQSSSIHSQTQTISHSVTFLTYCFQCFLCGFCCHHLHCYQSCWALSLLWDEQLSYSHCCTIAPSILPATAVPTNQQWLNRRGTHYHETFWISSSELHHSTFGWTCISRKGDHLSCGHCHRNPITPSQMRRVVCHIIGLSVTNVTYLLVFTL